jgi:hypothetical protein
MLRRDYFLQMLEDFAAVLARIAGLKAQGKFLEAQQLIQKTMLHYLKIEDKWLIDSTIDDFSRAVASNEQYSLEHLSILADLLQAKGEVWFEEYADNSLIINVLEKSLLVFDLINQRQSKLISLERQQKILTIRAILASL